MTHGIDTHFLLAATLHRAGIRRIVTNNERDFKLLAGLESVNFRP